MQWSLMPVYRVLRTHGFPRVRWQLGTGPSPGFRSRRVPEITRGCTFSKYNIGWMQQPGDQTWNGGRAPLAPPLATALPITKLISTFLIATHVIVFLRYTELISNYIFLVPLGLNLPIASQIRSGW